MEYYIQHRLGETAVAVLNEHGEMIGYTVERHHSPSLIGGIYVARVCEMNTSQSIVIVELGGQKAILNGGKNLIEGTCVLVQVVRDGFQQKLPAVQFRICVENAYFVINSTGKDVAFDRTIGQGKARAELQRRMLPIMGEDTGIFVKKNAVYADVQSLRQAYKTLRAELHTILQTKTNKVHQVRPAPSLIERTVHSAPMASVMIADDMQTYRLVKQAGQQTSTDINIHHYKQGDAFDMGGIYDMVDSLLYRKIDLLNGGSVVFDSAEALTAIDVNMGNVTNMNKGDDAVFRFNKTACRTIAQHIVLRNISGLIVIDFVRIKNRGMMKHIPKVLQSHMRAFDAYGVWDVMDITKSGLVEMTRKRTSPSLADMVLAPVGDRTKTPETMALELLQHLLRTVSVGTPTIFAPKPVIDMLQKSQMIVDCENRLKKTVALQVHTNAYTDWIQ